MSGKREFTRAELARMRRAQRASNGMEQSSSMRSFKSVVPITSRAVQMPALSTPQQATRRRFNIALGLPEFHLHKPAAMPRSRSHWRFVSFLIALLLGIAIYFALTLPYFHVPNITLLGNNRLSREEIEAVLGISGQSIFTVQPEQLETRLRMNYPQLASVSINSYLPNYVYVTIAERQPVILWQQGQEFTWIDSTGVAFRPHGAATGLIPVNGLTVPPTGVAPADNPLSPPPYMQKELVDAILVLAPHVPAGTTMVFDSVNGLGWTDSRGWKAYFGVSAYDMPLKIRVYESLVDSLVSRGKSPELISVVYPDAPYYRMAKVEVKDPTQDVTQDLTQDPTQGTTQNATQDTIPDATVNNGQ